MGDIRFARRTIIGDILGIKLRGSKKRRSYADYKPPTRHQGPSNDPFRIVFYLALITLVAYILVNPSIVQDNFQIPVFSGIPGASISSAETATPSIAPDQVVAQAIEAANSGNFDNAIELYNQAGELEPNNVEYHYQVARLLLFRSSLEYGDKRTKSLEDAIAAGNRTILADPFRPEGYAIYGKALDWSGKPEDASSQILRALDINPDYAIGQSYLAEALVDLQRWDQAMEAINKALALEPSNPDILRDYGYVLESLGDYASARTQYEAALQISPNAPHLKLSLAYAYRAYGEYDSALDQLFDADTLLPQNALIQFEIGRTYEASIGDPVTALEYYERATQIDEAYISPWVRIGTIRYLEGSYVQAIPAFERAIRAGVDILDVNLMLGLSYVNEGKCADAQALLQKVSTQAADDPDIQETIAAAQEQCKRPVTPTPAGSTPTPQP
jgi:tetratricopeptide (TPR) repeat protein